MEGVWLAGRDEMEEVSDGSAEPLERESLSGRRGSSSSSR